MRLSVFLIVAIALLPASAGAGGDCDLNTALSELKTEKHTTLTGPLTVEEFERMFGPAERWPKIKEWMKPGDAIYRAIFRDGRLRVISYIFVRDGCVRRRILESIT